QRWTRLVSLSAESAQGGARSRGLESRRQSNHELSQTIFRIRPAVPRRRLRLRYRRCLGRWQGQFLRHLAAGVASPRRYAELEKIRRGIPEEIRQAPGQPVLGRLQLAQNCRAV